ncbi:type II secretion system minor pseudopilin GspK [Pseudohongiella sp.]|uniref:T2SS protein K first SAM-like domain-containing protein n=1 Tax=marine sediment metagenome TaxID=412755 RepID=A0A0F9YL63_9ZZZZ|nr:type II secretion system minor pseudopilin GspK [Pseudohongiella sp.]HDZ10505.1 general secretion pathway protein GspK [Pseudohongiella sp.]HEA63860.1 general secretion pathway protein GspK [Pseudohongiella sp.]
MTVAHESRLGQPAHNRGSALVLALLIAGLVAVLAVQFGQAFLLQANRTENGLLQARFHAYLQGAETLAAQVLATDGMDSQLDHLQEAWATQLPPFPTDDGWLEVQLVDAQGLYNINNLSVKSAYQDDLSMPPAQRFSEQQKQFIRLLQSFAEYPLSEAEAIEITEAVIDWVDEDDQPAGPGGAESLYYSAESRALNAANQFVSDISELALVRHMSAELLLRIMPLVTALPVPTALNINSAPPQVLGAINASQDLEPLPADSVLALAQYRAQAFFGETAELATVPVLQGIGDKIALNESQSHDEERQNRPYGVASEYFIVYASATIGEHTRFMEALLFRDENGVRTLSRNFAL